MILSNSKRAQEGRFSFIKNTTIPSSKRAQEEMVGFILIIILVSVILMIFLAFTILKPRENVVESYEANNFLQSTLSHTSECSDAQGSLSIQKLIFKCLNSESCTDGEDSCKILNETLVGITSEAWKIGNGPNSGYEFNIFSEGNDPITIFEGNKTDNSRGAIQYFTKGGREAEIQFNIYA